MSRFSGKYDLCDNVLMGGERALERKENEDDLDFEIRCLELFKDRINGKMYQRFELQLTEYNIDREIELVNDERILSKIEHKSIKPDKRMKDGQKEVITYTYTHYGEEFNDLKDIRYYARRDIIVNSILDIVKYYDYTMAVHSSSTNYEYVQLTNSSYNDSVELNFRRYGMDPQWEVARREELRKHYDDIALRLAHHQLSEIKSKLDELQKDAGKKMQEEAINLIEDASKTTDDYQYLSGYFEAIADVNKLLDLR